MGYPTGRARQRFVYMNPCFSCTANPTGISLTRPYHDKRDRYIRKPGNEADFSITGYDYGHEI